MISVVGVMSKHFFKFKIKLFLTQTRWMRQTHLHDGKILYQSELADETWDAEILFGTLCFCSPIEKMYNAALNIGYPHESILQHLLTNRLQLCLVLFISELAVYYICTSKNN